MVAYDLTTYPSSVGRWEFLATAMTTGTLEAPIIHQLIYENKGNCQEICRGQFGTTKCFRWPQNVLKPLTVYCTLHYVYTVWYAPVICA